MLLGRRRVRTSCMMPHTGQVKRVDGTCYSREWRSAEMGNPAGTTLAYSSRKRLYFVCNTRQFQDGAHIMEGTL